MCFPSVVVIQEKNVSVNLVRALEYAKKTGAKIVGIVGRDGGYTGKVADACVIIPTVNAATVTAHAEAFQARNLAFDCFRPSHESYGDEMGIG